MDRKEQGSAEWDQATYWQRHVGGPGLRPAGPTSATMPAAPVETAGPGENAAWLPRPGRAIPVAARVVMAITGVVIVAVIVANSLGRGSATEQPPPFVAPLITSSVESAEPSLSADPFSPVPDSPSASPTEVPSPTPTASARSNPPRSRPAPAPAVSTKRPPQTIRMVSRVSGKAMRVRDASTSDGATIAQAPVSGAKEQQWRVIDAGSGFSNIVNVNSGKALDSLGSRADGTLVLQRTLSATNQNQQWRFTSVGGGFVVVTNRISGRVLDLRDGGLDDGNPIQQWTPFPDNRNQQWLATVVA